MQAAPIWFEKTARMSVRHIYSSILILCGCLVLACYAWLYITIDTKRSQNAIIQEDVKLIHALKNVRLMDLIDQRKLKHEFGGSDVVWTGSGGQIRLNENGTEQDINRRGQTFSETTVNESSNYGRKAEKITNRTEKRADDSKPESTHRPLMIADLEDVHIYLNHGNENKEKKSKSEIYETKGSNTVNRNKTDSIAASKRQEIYRKFYKSRKVSDQINCTKIALGHPQELAKASKYMHNEPRKEVTIETYINIKDCQNFKNERGYIQDPLSPEERDFPLAFGLLVYKDAEQVERLLRAVYRPHNFYCIHIDTKANDSFKAAVAIFSSCFDNVFLVPNAVNVTWGEFSVLEAELLCLKLLWRYSNWKYYINLTGQEFPLRTNREIVRVLMSMKGANIVDGTWIRAREKYMYRWSRAGKAPHGIRPIKGSVHVAINRYFVDFSLHAKRSRDFLEWLKKTEIPDETFFASLNHNPQLGIPGSFLGEPEESALKPFFMRYKNWEFGHGVYVGSCSGKYVRWLCILGVSDIHKALKSVGLFANKFHLNYEYIGYDCLDEILYEETWAQYLNNAEIDTTYYEQLDWVNMRLKRQMLLDTYGH